MTRRALASVVAVVLLFALIVVLAFLPTSYVVYRPGPTVNVLGAGGAAASGGSAKDPIIEVEGRRVYRDDGGLRLVTIQLTQPNQLVNVFSLMGAWLDRDDAVYPRGVVYGQDETTQQARQESEAQMTSSQDSAVAAALSVLNIPFRAEVRVAALGADSPARGVLEKGDLIRSVDGTQVEGTGQVISAIQAARPGSDVRLGVERDGTTRQVEVPTTASDQDASQAAIQAQIQLVRFDFPFDVSINLNQNIGGPSAGLMFSMGIYDVLTPGSLTDGRIIAGTGEIDAEGNVGEIGGIAQKIVGAQGDGARLFLVPAGNCAEALSAHYDPDKVRLAKVSTLRWAIAVVTARAEDPDASLPRCTA